MFKKAITIFIRTYSSFKRPPPGYMFKRPVVPSDLEPPTFPNENSKTIYDCENEKWTDQQYFHFKKNELNKNKDTMVSNEKK